MGNGIVPLQYSTNIGNGQYVLPKINPNLTLHFYGPNGGALGAYHSCDTVLIYNENTDTTSFVSTNTLSPGTGIPTISQEDLATLVDLNTNTNTNPDNTSNTQANPRFLRGINIDLLDHSREVPPYEIPNDTIESIEVKHAMDRLPSYDELQQNINTNGIRTSLFSPRTIIESQEGADSLNIPQHNININPEELPSYGELQQNINTNGIRTSLFLPGTIIESQGWFDSLNIPQHNININPEELQH